MERTIGTRGNVQPAVRETAAEKIQYQPLFWLFLTGSVVGFFLEGLWCIVKTGHWEHHAATLWGPFCIIYGIGAVAIYMMSHCLAGKSMVVKFGAFFLSGSLVEYFGSLFQERLLGSVSWDYSDHFMNIDGRVSLQMALTWGALGVWFMQVLYPPIKRLFQRIGGKKSAIACGVMTVFMMVNLLCTSMAVLRWRARLTELPATNRIEQVLDEKYGNEEMAKKFPNMRFGVETSANAL